MTISWNLNTLRRSKLVWYILLAATVGITLLIGIAPTVKMIYESVKSWQSEKVYIRGKGWISTKGQRFEKTSKEVRHLFNLIKERSGRIHIQIAQAKNELEDLHSKKVIDQDRLNLLIEKIEREEVLTREEHARYDRLVKLLADPEEEAAKKREEKKKKKKKQDQDKEEKVLSYSEKITQKEQEISHYHEMLCQLQKYFPLLFHPQKSLSGDASKYIPKELLLRDQTLLPTGTLKPPFMKSPYESLIDKATIRRLELEEDYQRIFKKGIRLTEEEHKNMTKRNIIKTLSPSPLPKNIISSLTTDASAIIMNIMEQEAVVEKYYNKYANLLCGLEGANKDLYEIEPNRYKFSSFLDNDYSSAYRQLLEERLLNYQPSDSNKVDLKEDHFLVGTCSLRYLEQISEQQQKAAESKLKTCITQYITQLGESYVYQSAPLLRDRIGLLVEETFGKEFVRFKILKFAKKNLSAKEQKKACEVKQKEFKEWRNECKKVHNLSALINRNESSLTYQEQQQAKNNLKNLSADNYFIVKKQQIIGNQITYRVYMAGLKKADDQEAVLEICIDLPRNEEDIALLLKETAEEFPQLRRLLVADKRNFLPLLTSHEEKISDNYLVEEFFSRDEWDIYAPKGRGWLITKLPEGVQRLVKEWSEQHTKENFGIQLLFINQKDKVINGEEQIDPKGLCFITEPILVFIVRILPVNLSEEEHLDYTKNVEPYLYSSHIKEIIAHELEKKSIQKLQKLAQPLTPEQLEKNNYVLIEKESNKVCWVDPNSGKYIEEEKKGVTLDNKQVQQLPAPLAHHLKNNRKQKQWVIQKNRRLYLLQEIEATEDLENIAKIAQKRIRKEGNQAEQEQIKTIVATIDQREADLLSSSSSFMQRVWPF